MTENETASIWHDILRPARQTTCVVFASPHSGRRYPADMVQRSGLSADQLRSSEDAFVDDLFASVVGAGAVMLCANAPRAYVDLNRAADELDPALFQGVKPVGHNPRVAGGLGVIPRVVANGRAIYQGKLPLQEAHRRLADVWHPYHNSLQGLLRETNAQFGQTILLDCHSMPREALENLTPKAETPEIVLGDRFGASAAAWVVDRVEASFANAGFRVSRNRPFAGAYITQNYGRPSRDQHCIQIEIDRSLYLEDHGRLEKGSRFYTLRDRLQPVIADLVALGWPDARGLAAE